MNVEDSLAAGHAHHFLSRLDRVSRTHVELALTIYRDEVLLRFILGCARVPESAERVAVSLDHPRRGPFLIVTREGHFVTCLGKGMRAGRCPVITRGQLDGSMALCAEHGGSDSYPLVENLAKFSALGQRRRPWNSPSSRPCAARCAPRKPPTRCVTGSPS